MRPIDLRVRVVAMTLAIVLMATTAASAVAQTEAKPTAGSLPVSGDTNLLVYHQITNLTEGTGGVGFPVLSADGTRAAFSTFLPSDDPAVYGTTTIAAMNADGSDLSDLDQYETLCNCEAVIDVSADGETIVLTDGVQVRIAGAGGGHELVTFSDRLVDALRITADGRTVFFLVGTDGRIREGESEIGRGVWAIDADGGNLRQIVAGEAVAAAIGVPVEEIFFYLDAQSLDVSDDGGRIVFGVYAHDPYQEAHYAFTGSGADGSLHLLFGPVGWLHRLAISGDGATVAYDVTPPGAENPVEDHDIGLVAGEGGAPRTLLTASRSADEDDWLQLSPDGSLLLVGPDSLLIDTATGEMEQLAVKTPFLDYDWTVLTDGLRAATMNAEATRFLYVVSTDACCYAQQLATLDLNPVELGDAPLIADASIDPDTVSLDGDETATAYAYVDALDIPLNVGLVALLQGRHDINVGYGAFLRDDGQTADAEAGDGIFTSDDVRYGLRETRNDDTGPRMVRIQAEVESEDGMRHATAVEFGPLTVTE